MLTTLRGRFEADPIRIPAPHRTEAGGDPFASVLDRAVQATPTDEPNDPAATEPEAAIPEPAAPAGAGDTPPATPAVDDAHEAPSAAADVADARTDVGAAAPSVGDTLRRGESERHETAGKGADSPRTSRPARPSAEPLLAAVVQQNATAAGPAGVSGGDAIGAVGAAAATRTGAAPTRAVALAEAHAATPGRAAAVTAGYRTQTAASAELLEHARDSVFKQILLQLDHDGGEMRLRLEPPELGELDLRLVVEQGNKLSLTIAAERADLAQLLQKHLGELQKALEASGLTITDAQVQTRRDGDREAGRPFDQAAPRRRGAVAADDDATLFPSMPRGGFVRADGLDFWA